jgi:catechol 2,3-dioxygenase-like lactoylglutathione lyase family enzyme
MLAPAWSSENVEAIFRAFSWRVGKMPITAFLRLLGDPEMLLSFNHVTVRSQDLERTERFYTAVLGLRSGWRPAFAQAGLWLYMGDAAAVHVLLANGEEAAGRIDHFAFNAQGLSGFLQRLKDVGQAYRLKRLPNDGDWQLFLHDPDGTLIEIDFPAHESTNGA